jgi:hypothetical protein
MLLLLLLLLLQQPACGNRDALNGCCMDVRCGVFANRTRFAIGA